MKRGRKERKALTETAITAASCPAGRDWVPLADAAQPGLYVRVYSTGTKSFWYVYRPAGGGRAVNKRWLRLGDVGAMSLKAARDAARVHAGAVAKGADPAAARREAKRQERARLKIALDQYEADLKRRKVVKRGEVLSILRREMLAPLGDVDLAALDRATLVRRIQAVRDSGRPGAAAELRTRAGVFLGWAVDQGLIPANPLAGWRQPRRTRAERIEQPGRALADAELAGFWRGAEAQGWPFGPYLQLLLLLGQRRTETAMMAWSDLVLDSGPGVVLWPDLPPQRNVWIVPPEITKSGRQHAIPLPRQAVAILEELPRLNGVDLVFPGRHGRAMTGWLKRLPDAYAATSAEGVAPWSPHDLRRTMRSGLGRLGVDHIVAELLLDHAISDELARIYDRGSHWQRRVEASQLWADHVFEQLDAKPARRDRSVERASATVIDLAERR
ncbi:MAG TPA: integrase arm-type DNA-binding domain-containing protein [Alphaproteobacteria bacterium]